MGTSILHLAVGLLLLIVATNGASLIGENQQGETTETSSGIAIEKTPDSSTISDVRRLTGPQLAAAMTVGTRVVKGKDWEWRVQDSETGQKGTVIHEVSSGWVEVEWDSGKKNTYRMGDDGKYDLDLADAHSDNEKSSLISASDVPLYGPELEDLMVDGARVVRGRDWKYWNQDGGMGKKGTVKGYRYGGWVSVTWDNGRSHGYRMGYDDKYDLSLAEHPWFSLETTTKSSGTAATSEIPLYGLDLTALMEDGARVVRGRDWDWRDQDGGLGSKGTVIGRVFGDWVTVRWDNGDTFSYPMGDMGRYDLSLAERPWFSIPISTTTQESSTAFTPEMPLSGPELVAHMKIGTRVARGKDWMWHNQDGGPGRKGTVTGILDMGLVKVRWDNGNSFNYRMGNGQYDLTVAVLPGSAYDSTTTEIVRTSTATDRTTTTANDYERRTLILLNIFNVQTINRLFREIIEQKISNLPLSSRFKVMQDILAILKNNH